MWLKSCICCEAEGAEFYNIWILMSGQSQLANEDDEVPVELLGSTKLL